MVNFPRRTALHHHCAEVPPKLPMCVDSQATTTHGLPFNAPHVTKLTHNAQQYRPYKVHLQVESHVVFSPDVSTSTKTLFNIQGHCVISGFHRGVKQQISYRVIFTCKISVATSCRLIYINTAHSAYQLHTCAAAA